MSAERLREAARVLRERANAATPGPWYVTAKDFRADVRGLPENTTFDHRGDRVAVSGDGEYGASDTPTATYIAAMSPPVALALADLLVELSDRWGGLIPKTQTDAAVLADAILGGGA